MNLNTTGSKSYPKSVQSKTTYVRISAPENLDVALEGLVRKVLKEQPKADEIYAFAAEYFETLVDIREKAGTKKMTASEICPFHNDEDAHELIKLATTFAKPNYIKAEPHTPPGNTGDSQPSHELDESFPISIIHKTEVETSGDVLASLASGEVTQEEEVVNLEDPIKEFVELEEAMKSENVNEVMLQDGGTMSVTVAPPSDETQKVKLTKSSETNGDQDENNSITTVSDEVQKESHQKTTENDEVQDQKITKTAESDELQDQNIMKTAESYEIQEENNTKATESGEIQEENNTKATESDEIQEENNTKATESDEIQEENNTKAIESDEIQEENNTKAIESDEIQEENNTKTTESDEIQEENNTKATESDELQEENNTKATESDDIHEENNTKATESDEIQEENNTKATESDDIHEENNTKATVSDELKEENYNLSTANEAHEEKSKISDQGQQASNGSEINELKREASDEPKAIVNDENIVITTANEEPELDKSNEIKEASVQGQEEQVQKLTGEIEDMDIGGVVDQDPQTTNKDSLEPNVHKQTEKEEVKEASIHKEAFGQILGLPSGTEEKEVEEQVETESVVEEETQNLICAENLPSAFNLSEDLKNETLICNEMENIQEPVKLDLDNENPVKDDSVKEKSDRNLEDISEEPLAEPDTTPETEDGKDESIGVSEKSEEEIVKLTDEDPANKTQETAELEGEKGDNLFKLEEKVEEIFGKKHEINLEDKNILPREISSEETKNEECLKEQSSEVEAKIEEIGEPLESSLQSVEAPVDKGVEQNTAEELDEEIDRMLLEGNKREVCEVAKSANTEGDVIDAELRVDPSVTADSMEEGDEQRGSLADTSALNVTTESSKETISSETDTPFITVQLTTVVETQKSDHDGSEDLIIEVEVEDGAQATSFSVADTMEVVEAVITIQRAYKRFREDKLKKQFKDSSSNLSNDKNTDCQNTDQTNTNARDITHTLCAYSETVECIVDGVKQSTTESTASSQSSSATRINRGELLHKRTLNRRTTERSFFEAQSLDVANKTPLVRTKSLTNSRQGLTDFEVWNTIEKELEAAATKIQSNFRGYKTRKTLKREDAVQITTTTGTSASASTETLNSWTPRPPSPCLSQHSTGEFHDTIVLSIHPL